MKHHNKGPCWWRSGEFPSTKHCQQTHLTSSCSLFKNLNCALSHSTKASSCFYGRMKGFGSLTIKKIMSKEQAQILMNVIGTGTCLLLPVWYGPWSIYCILMASPVHGWIRMLWPPQWCVAFFMGTRLHLATLDHNPDRWEIERLLWLLMSALRRGKSGMEFLW